jgi:hypothetical protein
MRKERRKYDRNERKLTATAVARELSIPPKKLHRELKSHGDDLDLALCWMSLNPSHRCVRSEKTEREAQLRAERRRALEDARFLEPSEPVDFRKDRRLKEIADVLLKSAEAGSGNVGYSASSADRRAVGYDSDAD